MIKIFGFCFCVFCCLASDLFVLAGTVWLIQEKGWSAWFLLAAFLWCLIVGTFLVNIKSFFDK